MGRPERLCPPLTGLEQVIQRAELCNYYAMIANFIGVEISRLRTLLFFPLTLVLA
jgi:hypothetical protein